MVDVDCDTRRSDDWSNTGDVSYWIRPLTRSVATRSTNVAITYSTLCPQQPSSTLQTRRGHRADDLLHRISGRADGVLGGIRSRTMLTNIDGARKLQQWLDRWPAWVNESTIPIFGSEPANVAGHRQIIAALHWNESSRVRTSSLDEAS
jgi:hypothetical protein